MALLKSMFLIIGGGGIGYGLMQLVAYQDKEVENRLKEEVKHKLKGQTFVDKLKKEHIKKSMSQTTQTEHSAAQAKEDKPSSAGK